MKKFLAVAILSAVVSACSLYPEAGTIVEIENDIVTVETGNGNCFQFEGREDLETGDRIAMIMCGCFTETVEDDMIIKIKYCS